MSGTHAFYEVDKLIEIAMLPYDKMEEAVQDESFSKDVIAIADTAIDSAYSNYFKETEYNFSKIDFNITEEEFLNNIRNIIEANEKEYKESKHQTKDNENKTQDNLVNIVEENASNEVDNNAINNTDLDFSKSSEIVYVWTDAEPQSEFLKDTLTLRKDGTVEKIEESMGTVIFKGTYTYENGKIIASYTEQEITEPGGDGSSYREATSETNEFEFINGILYENIRTYKHEFTRK